MILLGSSIMVVGAILQCSAFSLAHLIVGRIVTGFGNGMNTSTVPTWASETSRSHKRGKMVMIEGAMITGGICLSYVRSMSLYTGLADLDNFFGPENIFRTLLTQNIVD